MYSQASCPFHLSFQISSSRIVGSVPLLAFCRICTDIPCLLLVTCYSLGGIDDAAPSSDFAGLGGGMATVFSVALARVEESLSKSLLCCSSAPFLTLWLDRESFAEACLCVLVFPGGQLLHFQVWDMKQITARTTKSDNNNHHLPGESLLCCSLGPKSLAGLPSSLHFSVLCLTYR